jgi:DNA helicase-2/ATP-dependent DNA helicase PcrA
MLQRATGLLDRRCEEIAGGSFHSFGNLILCKNASALGILSQIAIFDRVDAEALISMLRKEMRTATKNRSLPRKHTLASIFSRAVKKMVPVEDVVYDDDPQPG